jgi:hypothetical protein
MINTDIMHSQYPFRNNATSTRTKNLLQTDVF